MISDLTVLQSNYEPQYGSSGVVIVMETKSGTNKFHGTAFEFLRNTALNARQFNAAKKPVDKENDFGLSLGGPLQVPGARSDRSRAYFFFNWEGFRQRGAPTRPTLTIPSLQERVGDFSDWKNTAGVLTPIYDPATTRVVNGVTVRDQFMGCDGKSPNVICPNRLNSIALSWFKFLPQPTSPGPTSNFIPEGNGSNWMAGANIYNGRLDWYLGEKDHLTVSVYRRDMPAQTESFLPEQVSTDSDTYKYTWSNRLNWDRVISPTLLFHLSGAYNHDYYSAGAHNAQYADALPKIPGAPSHLYPPQISFGDGFTALGNRTGFVKDNKWPAPAVSGNTLVTWIKDKHTLKFGFEYRNQRDSWQNSSGEAGWMSFASLTTGILGATSGNSVASFLLGQVSSAGMSYWPHGLISARWNTWIAHVGDTWRVTKKLNLSLGLRWDMEEPTVEQHNVFSFFDAAGPNPTAASRPGRMVFAGNGWGQYSAGVRQPEDRYKKALGPRLGITYALDQKTVARLGYGVYYDPGYYPGYQGGIDSAGFNGSYSFSGSADGLLPVILLGDSLPPVPGKLPPFLDASFLNGQSGPLYRPREGNRKPYSQQWNFGLERQVTADLHVNVAYVGSKGTRLLSRLAPLNALDPKLLAQYGSLLNGRFTSSMTSLNGVSVPYPGWVAQMTGCSPTVAQALLPYPQYCGSLQGINEHAGNSTYHSLQVRVDKRLARGTWLLSSYTFSKLLTDSESTQGSGSGMSPFERRRAKSLSTGDIPHAFSVAALYDLPVGRGRRWLRQNRFLDYVVGGWRLSSILRINSGSPMSITSGTCTVPGQFRVTCRPGQLAGVNAYAQDKSNFDVTKPLLDVKAFEPAASFQYYYGVGPRVTSLRRFGYHNQDVTLMKNFQIKEKVTLQVRGDFFNVYNWHILTGFSTNVAATNFGMWTGGVTAPRYIQLGGRISF